MKYSRIYAKAWLIILLSFFLISCANHSTEKSLETSAFQPGEKSTHILKLILEQMITSKEF